jgi:glycosyltransferase involved in cell wall biosynthesis
MGFAERISSWRERRPAGGASPDTASQSLKMSVVVAVHNTGDYLEPCLASLVGQSLPPTEYEVILVDDGSDDGITAARLDHAAAVHPHLRAIHIRNSGWPGKPRNVGIDAARGEYVYVMDHDDMLAPEALERMYAMASRNDADVVIGKIAGRGRRVPPTLFRENREACTLETAPLMESMTPHKGFRRAFLKEHRLRFPEGRRRLEDHVFVVEAYLRARVVSVLSDYTCYTHIARDDEANAGFQAIAPIAYYANLREAVEIVEGLTEPGPRRDLVLRRWYSVEMMRRISGGTFASRSPQRQQAFYTEIRRLAEEHFARPTIWQPLPAAVRVVAELMRADRFEDLVALGGFEGSLRVHADTEAWHWEGGRLRFQALVGVASESGQPAITVVDGVPVYAAHLTDVPLEASTARNPTEAWLQLVRRGSRTRVRLPLEVVTVTDDGALRYRVQGDLDPLDVVGAGPLEAGIWDLYLKLRAPDVGPDHLRRLGNEHGTVTADRPAVPALVGTAGLAVVPYLTEKGNLSLDVGATSRLVEALRPGVATVRPGAGGASSITVTLPLHLADGGGEGLRIVRALPHDVEVSGPATPRPAGRPDQAVLESHLPAAADPAATEVMVTLSHPHRILWSGVPASQESPPLPSVPPEPSVPVTERAGG